MKLYLTRHGETDWNKQMIIQGTTDNPLNKRGQEQADSIKQFFENIDIDLIVASSLSRARETAQIATNTQPDIIDDRFIERDFGYFEGKDVDLFYTTPNKLEIENFEQDEQVISRVYQGLEDYANTTNETIAIFAHSHVLKAALTAIEPDNYNFSSKIKNCAIVEIEYENGNFSLIDIH